MPRLNLLKFGETRVNLQEWKICDKKRTKNRTSNFKTSSQRGDSNFELHGDFNREKQFFNLHRVGRIYSNLERNESIRRREKYAVKSEQKIVDEFLIACCNEVVLNFKFMVDSIESKNFPTLFSVSLCACVIETYYYRFSRTPWSGNIVDRSGMLWTCFATVLCQRGVANARENASRSASKFCA